MQISPLRVLPFLLLSGLATSAPLAQGTTWQPTLDVGTFPGQDGTVELADIDGDGRLDVVRAENALGFGSVTWFRNPGDGSGLWSRTDVDGNGHDMALPADIDGDGALDLVASRAGTLKVYRNDLGDGSAWSSIDIVFFFLLARDNISIADVDGDGDVDIVVGISIPVGIAWYENQAGDGTLWNRRDLPYPYAAISTTKAADFDVDGDCDVAFSFLTTLGWFENVTGDGSSWLEQPVDLVGGSKFIRRAADFDGDGAPDLAVTNIGVGSEYYHNAAGDGSAWTKTRIDGSWSTASARDTDMDGDGDVDLLMIDYDLDAVKAYENVDAVAGHFPRREAVPIEATAGAVNSFTLGDVTGDGVVDLVVGNATDDTVQVYESQPANRFFAPGPSQLVDSGGIASPQALALEDVDADGDVDAIGAFPNISRIYWWSNNGVGGNWSERTVSNSVLGTDLDTGDVDGDGDADVLATDAFNGSVQWFENTGSFTGAWTGRTIDTPSAPSALDGADVDGDGDLDVLVAAEGDDALGWYRNTDGTGLSWSTQLVSAAAPGASWIAGADLDGDGDQDVLGADSQLDSLAWYANEGGLGLAWTPTVLAVDVPDAERLVAGDFDGDGDLDLAGSGSAFDAAVLFENTDGTGSSWTRTDVALPLGLPTDLAVSDLDGDGSADVLATTTGGSLWLDERGGQWLVRTLSTSAASRIAGAELDGDDLQDLVIVEDTTDTRWTPNEAAFLRYGSSVNPAGSLVLEAGAANIDNGFAVGIDNPFGTQGAGSASFLAFSLAPAPGFPAGISLPGLGMGGPGAPGELLVDLTPRHLPAAGRERPDLDRQRAGLGLRRDPERRGRGGRRRLRAGCADRPAGDLRRADRLDACPADHARAVALSSRSVASTSR